MQERNINARRIKIYGLSALNVRGKSKKLSRTVPLLPAGLHGGIALPFLCNAARARAALRPVVAFWLRLLFMILKGISSSGMVVRLIPVILYAAEVVRWDGI
jgi:hypothetical protein